MKILNFLKASTLLFGLIFFGLIAFLFSFVALILSPVFSELRYYSNDIFLRPFSIFTRKLIGVKVELLNAERLKSVRPAVFIGNHQTGLDLAILSSGCPSRSVIVAKKELGRIPFFGWFLAMGGNLLIDRKKSIKAKNSLEKIKKQLLKHQLNLCIFPEGTRSPDQKLLPFKKGAFYFAVSMGLPIVPVVCSKLTNIAIWEKFQLNGGKVIISFLEPIETKSLSSEQISELQNRIWNLMNDELNRISKI